MTVLLRVGALAYGSNSRSIKTLLALLNEGRSPDTCWEWPGPRDEDGYGRVAYNSRSRRAHRAAWLLTRGPLDDGHLVCHTCDNPPCVNPGHLFVGTQLTNQRDKWAKGRGTAGARNGAHLHPESRPVGGRSRLVSEDDIIDIRTLAAFGARTRDLAAAFAVTHHYIRSIVTRRTWREIP